MAPPFSIKLTESQFPSFSNSTLPPPSSPSPSPSTFTVHTSSANKVSHAELTFTATTTPLDAFTLYAQWRNVPLSHVHFYYMVEPDSPVYKSPPGNAAAAIQKLTNGGDANELAVLVKEELNKLDRDLGQSQLPSADERRNTHNRTPQFPKPNGDITLENNAVFRPLSPPTAAELSHQVAGSVGVAAIEYFAGEHIIKTTQTGTIHVLIHPPHQPPRLIESVARSAFKSTYTQFTAPVGVSESIPDGLFNHLRKKANDKAKSDDDEIDQMPEQEAPQPAASSSADEVAADEQAKEASRLQAFEVRFRNEHEREPTPFEIRFYRWADKGKDWMKSSPFSLPLIIMLVVVGSITSMELNTPDLSFVPNYTYYTVSKAGNAGITPPRAVRDLQNAATGEDWQHPHGNRYRHTHIDFIKHLQMKPTEVLSTRPSLIAEYSSTVIRDYAAYPLHPPRSRTNQQWGTHKSPMLPSSSERFVPYASVQTISSLRSSVSSDPSSHYLLAVHLESLYTYHSTTVICSRTMHDLEALRSEAIQHYNKSATGWNELATAALAEFSDNFVAEANPDHLPATELPQLWSVDAYHRMIPNSTVTACLEAYTRLCLLDSSFCQTGVDAGHQLRAKAPPVNKEMDCMGQTRSIKLADHETGGMWTEVRKDPKFIDINQDGEITDKKYWAREAHLYTRSVENRLARLELECGKGLVKMAAGAVQEKGEKATLEEALVHFQGCTSISPMFCLDGYYSEIVVLVALGRREEAVERVKQYSVQLFAMLQLIDHQIDPVAMTRKEPFLKPEGTDHEPPLYERILEIAVLMEWLEFDLAGGEMVGQHLVRAQFFYKVAQPVTPPNQFTLEEEDYCPLLHYMLLVKSVDPVFLPETAAKKRSMQQLQGLTMAKDFRTPPAIVAALTDFQTTMRMVDPTAYRISKTSDVALGLIGGALGDVLDVGCGMGDTGLRMKPRSNRMTGVEISEMAAYKSEKLGIYERVVRGDFADWGHRDVVAYNYGGFDTVVMIDVAAQFGCLERLMDGLTAVTKVGSRIVFDVDMLSDDAGTGRGNFELKKGNRWQHTQSYVNELLETFFRHFQIVNKKYLKKAKKMVMVMERVS